MLLKHVFSHLRVDFSQFFLESLVESVGTLLMTTQNQVAPCGMCINDGLLQGERVVMVNEADGSCRRACQFLRVFFCGSFGRRPVTR